MSAVATTTTAATVHAQDGRLLYEGDDIAEALRVADDHIATGASVRVDVVERRGP